MAALRRLLGLLLGFHLPLVSHSRPECQMIRQLTLLLRRVQGDAVFLKGNWSAATFIFDYGIIGLALVIGIGWKLVKRTPFRRSDDVDLTSGLELFDDLTDHYRREREAKPDGMKDKILAKMF